MKLLTELCQHVTKAALWSKEWKRSVHIPVARKGDLVSNASKVRSLKV